MMAEAIYSLHDLAMDKGQLEFILKVDDDDQPTMDAVSKLQLECPLRAIVSPRGRGYADMHVWVNQMSSIAKGDWLYLWNDDARMTTHHWDQVLANTVMLDTRRSTEIMLLVTPVLERPEAKEFMFLRRKVYEILGHWSLSPHNDVWIYWVMGFIGAIHKVAIHLNHHHGLVDDETWRGVRAHYEKQDDSTTGFSDEHIQARLEDVKKLIQYQESLPRRTA